MITLLRRIRRSLINNAQIRKYLIYAIGEIALVVIGILIALQINNWNTQKQEQKELYSYLENINGNLKEDLKSLDEIKTFRDSSMAFSWRWLNLAKEESITPEELCNQANSRFGVFIDQYFQSRSSGFEALKTSGFIGKLNGTSLEQKLNNYYYTVDKISEGETSLNNTIETMENLAFDKNVRQRVIEICEAYRTQEELPTNINAEIKDLVNQPNLIAANRRNAVDSFLLGLYSQAEELAKSLIAEIETRLKE